MLKGFFFSIKGIIVIGALIFAVAFGVVWFREFYSASTADTRGTTDVREKTVADGDYRIAAYEQFYDKCASIKAKESDIANVEDEIERGVSEQREQELNGYLLALRNTRADLIHQYNADASKTETRANFLASDLPFEIPLEGDTTCSAPEN